MNVMDSYSQEFGGTWMRLDLAHDVMLFPRLNILKVENQKITSFEFNSIYEEFEGSMDEYFGIKPKSTGAGFEWYGPNILVVKCRASNYDTKEKVIFEQIFVRLKPTRIPADFDSSKIINGRYILSLNGREYELSFNEPLPFSQIPYLSERGVLGEKIMIERIKDFYFLSFYLDDEISSIIPISEFNNDGFVIYGFSKENDSSQLKRIN
nr:hypothetical protein [uncultured Allomuricauda sp.]